MELGNMQELKFIGISDEIYIWVGSKIEVLKWYLSFNLYVYVDNGVNIYISIEKIQDGVMFSCFVFCFLVGDRI